MKKNTSFYRLAKDPVRLASAAAQLRSGRPIAIVLVEGEDDSSFFDHLEISGCCTSCDGKAGVLRVRELLTDRKIAGVIAIVDADYATLDGAAPAGIMVTDTHDIETLILSSPALRKVVRECLRGEAAANVDSLVAELGEALLDAGEPFGCLRWASARGDLGLDFQDLDPCEFLDSDTLSVQVEAVIRWLRDPIRGPVALTDHELSQRVRALRAKGRDRWLVCQGHDLVKLLPSLLAALLERRGESLSAQRARYRTPASIEKDLRLSYEPRFFRKTKLYGTLREWEARNPKYAVLAQEE
jgi:hypothetical protein